MQVLKNILNSEKTNIGKLELVDKLQKAIMGLSIEVSFDKENKQKLSKIKILGLISDEIITKPTWGKNQLKDLFLEKILKNL